MAIIFDVFRQFCQWYVVQFLFFFLSFCSSDCVCRHNPVAPATMVSATQQRHDKQHHGGGSNVGSNTPPHDTRSHDSNKMNSVAVAAVMWAAAHCCTTLSHPTATRQAAQRRHGSHRSTTCNHPTARQ